MNISKFFKDLSTELKAFSLAQPAAAPIPARKFNRSGLRAFLLVLDTSPSMEAEDYPPSRLAAAKTAATAFVVQCVKHTPQAMVGIVFFNGDGTLAQPLSPVAETHHRLNRLFNTIEVNGGTDISAGLHVAHTEFLKSTQEISPTIVLLTDGESNGGDDPVETARALKAAGVQLDIIGIGGSPQDVNECDLKQMASVVEGQLRYWFIRDTPTLVRKFEALALAKV